MNKRTRSGVLATTIVAGVLLVFLNVFAFAIPFAKQSMPAHYVNYGLASFVIIAQGVIFAVTMFGERDLEQRVIGLPIIYSGFVALIMQFVVTTIFFVVNAFVALPIWVIVVIEMLVIAYMALCVAKGFFFKSHVESIKDIKKSTAFMDEFRARLSALNSINHIKGVSKELEDLYDTARGSDPVTNDKTVDSESELLSLLQGLDKSIKEGNEEESRNAIRQIKDTLIERNALSKIGK